MKSKGLIFYLIGKKIKNRTISYLRTWADVGVVVGVVAVVEDGVVDVESVVCDVFGGQLFILFLKKICFN